MKVSNREDRSSSTIPFFTNLIATGLFSGYLPWASGTFGTLVGVLIYLLPGTENPLILGTMIVVGFLAGVGTSARVAAIVGNALTRTAEVAKSTFRMSQHGVDDPSIVVIDEIVGIWISLLFLPKNVFTILIAFFIFRAFDIVKPPPARQMERLPDGWGIMLDDVVAGIYANLSSQIILVVIRQFFPNLISN